MLSLLLMEIFAVAPVINPLKEQQVKVAEIMKERNGEEPVQAL